MKPIAAAALVVLSLTAAACGPTPEERKLAADRERSKIIPDAPTGPAHATTGTVHSADLRTVTLDHEGAAAAGLAPGRTTFRTWADVVANPLGEPGARVAVKVQKLGDGWAVVEMTGR